MLDSTRSAALPPNLNVRMRKSLVPRCNSMYFTFLCSSADQHTHKDVEVPVYDFGVQFSALLPLFHVPQNPLPVLMHFLCGWSISRVVGFVFEVWFLHEMCFLAQPEASHNCTQNRQRVKKALNCKGA